MPRISSQGARYIVSMIIATLAVGSLLSTLHWIYSNISNTIRWLPSFDQPIAIMLVSPYFWVIGGLCVAATTTYGYLRYGTLLGFLVSCIKVTDAALGNIIFDEPAVRGRVESEDVAWDVFKNQFEAYRGQSRYMIGSDQETLTNNARSIYEQIRTLAREIDLQILLEDDTKWLRDCKARFEQLTELLSRYNEVFVEQEQERYAELFETEHGTLNTSQQEAIIRDDRRNLVDASAGTGKTLILTYRFIYLLRKGVAIDDIAAVTFTNDAANEMKQRIADQIDDMRESDLDISTIHKFASKIAQRNRQERNNLQPGEKQEEIAREYYLAATSGQSRTKWMSLTRKRIVSSPNAFNDTTRLSANSLVS